MSCKNSHSWETPYATGLHYCWFNPLLLLFNFAEVYPLFHRHCWPSHKHQGDLICFAKQLLHIWLGLILPPPKPWFKASQPLPRSFSLRRRRHLPGFQIPKRNCQVSYSHDGTAISFSVARSSFQIWCCPLHRCLSLSFLGQLGGQWTLLLSSSLYPSHFWQSAHLGRQTLSLLCWLVGINHEHLSPLALTY